MKRENRKKAAWIFAGAFLLAILVLGGSVLKTQAYNRARHHAVLAGPGLFSPEASAAKAVTVNAVPRGSTWSKAFDFNNEGITEHNYQAYTYDFTLSNNTRDQVADYSFKLTFQRDVYLMSAWNEALEIHQLTPGGETVSLVTDLREFVPEEHPPEDLHRGRGYPHRHEGGRLFRLLSQFQHERIGGAHRAQ